MVRAGAPLIVVARALGHSDMRMVDKHYACAFICVVHDYAGAQDIARVTRRWRPAAFAKQFLILGSQKV
jgi:hypothetical protein